MDTKSCNEIISRNENTIFIFRMQIFENFTESTKETRLISRRNCHLDLEIFDISGFITLQYQVQNLRLDKLSLNCIYLAR